MKGIRRVVAGVAAVAVVGVVAGCGGDGADPTSIASWADEAASVVGAGGGVMSGASACSANADYDECIKGEAAGAYLVAREMRDVGQRGIELGMPAECEAVARSTMNAADLYDNLGDGLAKGVAGADDILAAANDINEAMGEGAKLAPKCAEAVSA